MSHILGTYTCGKCGYGLMHTHGIHRRTWMQLARLVVVGGLDTKSVAEADDFVARADRLLQTLGIVVLNGEHGLSTAPEPAAHAGHVEDDLFQRMVEVAHQQLPGEVRGNVISAIEAVLRSLNA